MSCFSAWADYFDALGLDYAFWSAKMGAEAASSDEGEGLWAAAWDRGRGGWAGGPVLARWGGGGGRPVNRRQALLSAGSGLRLVCC